MSSYIHRDPLPSFLKLPYAMYKWVFFVPFLALTTFVIGLIISVLGLLGMPDFASRVFATRWARINATTAMMKVHIAGADKVDSNASYIIVANHQSLIDILVLYGYLDMDIKWVMKQELRAVPVFGLAAESMGHILINRSNTAAAQASNTSAHEKIRNGMSVIFFPEGTRSRTGELKNFKKGAFRLAQELQLPVLPIAIHGTKNILPSDTVAMSPGSVTLEFCDPIPTTGLQPGEVSSLSRQARDSIQTALISRL